MVSEIYPALTLCICHITPESLEWLANQEVEHVQGICTFNDNGVFIKLHEQLEDNIKSGMPNDLAQIITYCWQEGARLIELSNEAEPIENLPEYDWD